MKMPLLQSLAIVAIALSGTTAAVAADTFPSKPIRIVLTSAPGGSLDTTTRLVAKHMSETLGQQVIVDNLAGAGGIIAIRTVKSAPADGYTLLGGVNTVVIQQWVNENPGYDVVKDFKGVGTMSRSPFVLVASPNQPDKTLADVIARAKANPGKLTYASAGLGSTTHLSAALFARSAGIDLTHIPYKGNPASWPDLIDGRVDMLMEGYGSGASMLQSGRLKALGVTSAKRLAVLPDVPTIAEQGAPGYSFYFWIGMLAPAGTPSEVVQKLSTAVRSAIASPQLEERFAMEGSEALPQSPAEFDEFLERESSATAKLVTELRLPKQ